jgi:hypothetical protein
MATYRVTWGYTHCEWVDVEATNEAEALEKAEKVSLEDREVSDFDLTNEEVEEINADGQ